MRKSVYSALLSALSLVSLPMAAAASQAAGAAAPVPAAKAAVAQAAPGVPASDTAGSTVKPPESAPKADSATAAAAANPGPAAAAVAPVPDSSAARPALDSAAASVPAPVPAPAADAAATAPGAVGQDAAADSLNGTGAKPKKRKRIVRETTVNTIDELKGRYRSPKKALFMSLLVPGLGQAYVGQHWSNYARGAGYLMLDVGLILGWNHYVNTKQDRQIRNYRRFADENWSLSRYEDSISVHADAGFSDRNPHRETYCQAVQSQQGTTGKARYDACKDPGTAANQVSYSAFRNEHSDRGLDADSVGKLREAFPSLQNFYELIGKEVEFVNGWKDAEGIITGDSTFTLEDGSPATTPLQQEYIDKRAKANEYARMQAWFLGGMVLNHIVSALDAAFAANVHNKSLYQTEVGMLERLRFDSGLAWDGPFPRPSVTASLTF